MLSNTYSKVFAGAGGNVNVNERVNRAASLLAATLGNLLTQDQRSLDGGVARRLARIGAAVDRDGI